MTDRLSKKPIVAVFDGRPEIVAKLSATGPERLEFVNRELGRLRDSLDFGYATLGYLRESPGRAQPVV